MAPHEIRRLSGSVDLDHRLHGELAQYTEDIRHRFLEEVRRVAEQIQDVKLREPFLTTTAAGIKRIFGY